MPPFNFQNIDFRDFQHLRIIILPRHPNPGEVFFFFYFYRVFAHVGIAFSAALDIQQYQLVDVHKIAIKESLSSYAV
jgi:hypothetical protein